MNAQQHGRHNTPAGNRHGGPDRHHGQPPDRISAIDQARVSQILAHDAVEIDRSAREIAGACASLTPTQIRNFYGPIVKLRAELQVPPAERLPDGEPKPSAPKAHANALMMHRARLHYLAARESRGNADAIRDWFSKVIDDAVRGGSLTKERVEAICDLAEAVVAYHYEQQKRRQQ